MARVGDAGDQLNAVQVYHGDAPRPCKNCREWTSETVVESAAARALADSDCFCGGGGEKSWMAAGDAARRNESCAIGRGDFRTILGKEVLEEKGELCEGTNPLGASRGSSQGWVSVAFRGKVSGKGVFFFFELTRLFFVQFAGQWPQG